MLIRYICVNGLADFNKIKYNFEQVNGLDDWEPFLLCLSTIRSLKYDWKISIVVADIV